MPSFSEITLSDILTGIKYSVLFQSIKLPPNLFILYINKLDGVKTLATIKYKYS